MLQGTLNKPEDKVLLEVKFFMCISIVVTIFVQEANHVWFSVLEMTFTILVGKKYVLLQV